MKQTNNPNDRTSLENDLSVLKNKKMDLEKEVFDVAREISQVSCKLSDLNYAELKEQKRKIGMEEEKTYIKKILAEKLFNCDNYPLALKIAMVTYLKEYYLTLIKTQLEYDINKNHNDQMNPLFEMQQVLLRIGVCLETFTQDIFDRVSVSEKFDYRVGTSRLSEDAISERAMFGWSLAIHWERIRHEILLSSEDIEDLFDEIISPHQNKVSKSKEALNLCYDILFFKKVWK